MGAALAKPLVRNMSAQLTVLVRARIVSGAYAPGSALLQDALAAEFGVSKIPVREALLQLHGEGLVEVFAHRGFQVRALSGAEAQEIFRLRLALEPAAIAHGAALADEVERHAAETACRELREALAAGRLEEAGDLNRAFHLSLVLPARQPLTAGVLDRLLTLAQRYVRLHLQPRGRASRAGREHEALLTAWRRGESRRLTELARTHIESTHEDLARALASAAP